jgi:hypothetical protein
LIAMARGLLGLLLAGILVVILGCSGCSSGGGSGGVDAGGAGGMGGGAGGRADAAGFGGSGGAARDAGAGGGAGGGGSTLDAAGDLGVDQGAEVAVLGSEAVYTDAFVPPWSFGTASQATVDTASATNCFAGAGCVAVSFQPGGSFSLKRTPAAPSSNYIGLQYYVRMTSGTATALAVQLRGAGAACSYGTIPTVSTAWQRVVYVTAFACGGVGDVDEIVFANMDTQPVNGVIFDEITFP